MTLNAYATAYLTALTTVPSVEAGQHLVRALLERRLVGCGTILPGAHSLFWWNGAITEAGESVVLLKTTVGCWAALKEALPALHPYDVPELIVLPIAGGHKPYLDWLSVETRDGSVEKA